MNSSHPLQCQCGTIKGHVEREGMANRVVCYCDDCQAFARFLDRADAVLDAQGGTGIVAILPKQLHFTQGIESLACMSLSDRGMYRWYASCCNTPIGNTPRDFKMPYVGLVDACLKSESPSLQSSFGPIRMVLGTQYAKGTVKGTPVSNVLTLLCLMLSVIGARLRGGYKSNPFFTADTGAPVVRPRELSKSERERFLSPREGTPSP